MLKQTSKNFKEFFILEFVKEMIRSTEKYKEIIIKKEVHEVLLHQEFLKKLGEKHKLKEKEKVGKIVRKKFKKEREKISNLKKEESLTEFKFQKSIPQKRPLPFTGFGKQTQISGIPELALPETVRDIMPVPGTTDINLGKLDVLIRDPLVKEIICHGADEKIIVKGAMGRKSTGIKLKKEEIDEVIEKFSEVSKIPISTGLFKVVHGNLVLSAVISEVVDSRFRIKKMSRPPINIPLPPKR